jgi:pilin isopeptide linkage protein
MPPQNEVTVVGPALAEFGDAHYEWVGVYTYEIAETIGNYVGYTFDGRIWTVTITVVDNNGKLEATHEYVADDGAQSELAEFHNLFETSTLTVKKTVTGFSIDTSRAFKFTVELFDENDQPLYGQYEYTGAVGGWVKDGKAEFELHHDESITITDIPLNAKWVVTEARDDEYIVTIGKPEGIIEREGSLSAWVNDYVPTGMPGVWINVGDCFE